MNPLEGIFNAGGYMGNGPYDRVTEGYGTTWVGNDPFTRWGGRDFLGGREITRWGGSTYIGEDRLSRGCDGHYYLGDQKIWP